MRGIFESWMEELPQQFKGKKHIEAVIKAFSRQLEELYQVSTDLNEKTNLDTAVMKNLDMAGDILSLDRKDAYVIIRKSKHAEITDYIYRQVLRYQAIRNNSECTYYDIMDSMSLLWDTSPVRYVEDPAHPAMIYLSMPTVDIDGIDPAVGKILAIKPSGVGVLYTIGYVIPVNISGLEVVAVVNLTFTTGMLWNVNRFPIRLSLENMLGIIRHRETVTAAVSIHGTAAVHQETAGMNPMVIRYAFSWWNTQMLNGYFLLNGSYLLDAVMMHMNPRINIGAITAEHNETIDVEVDMKRSYWELNGTYVLDGVRRLNAARESEVL